MKKNNTLVIIAAIVIIISCQKERRNSDPSGSQVKNLNDSLWNDDHGDSIDPSLATTVTPGTSPISTNCITVSGGILKFSSMACFTARMAEIVNTDVDVIDDWEDNLNFTSRRTYYNHVEENDDDIDDADADSIRLDDSYFESVLSYNDEIIIGDTLYTFNFSNGSIACMKLSDSSTWTLNNTYQFKKTTYCGNHDNHYGDKQYGNGEFMKSKKYVNNFGFYSNVGIRQDYYKLNWKGKAKKYRTDKLTLFIDEWHLVTGNYEHSAGQLPFTKGGTAPGVKSEVDNEKDQNWIITWAVQTPGQYHCVEKFERFHVYKADFYNDMHHDNW